MSKSLVTVLRSMLLPVSGRVLMLPSVSIAEITPYKGEQAITGSPDWFKGMMEWRGTDVPLISIETLETNQPINIQPKAQVAVLNMIRENIQFPYLGFILQGLPRMVMVDAYQIITLGLAVESLFEMKVMLGDDYYEIPNLDKLQTHVETYLSETGLMFSMDNLTDI